MVAPNKNQPRELSASFSVNNVVEGDNHSNNNHKETIVTPKLEMEQETREETSTTSNSQAKKKSVTFSENVHIRCIPVLTQEEKNELFFNKQDKRNSKLELRRLVTFHRTSPSNNFFFTPSQSQLQDQSQIIQIPLEEQTKIGLEAHISPQFKLGIRKRMVKLVLQHQQWCQQHPTFFDNEFLGQNCTTVAQSATLMAVERAQTVVNELAQDKAKQAPIENITVVKKEQSPQDQAEHSTDFSVSILCSPAEPDAATATAIET
ncbi:MAG: hypothetical protein SGBAC_009868, partial [Bacillariaceae sp.]